MYSESTLGTLTSPLHDDIRARLSLKAPKQLGAIFCIRLLIWPIDRFCHHVHWRCKLGCGYTALKAWRWYNTAQAILTSLLASATTTTLNGFVARKLINQSPNTFPVVSILDSTDLAPCINRARRCLLPRLLMPNNFDLPPVEYCLGTSPSHAAISRPPPKFEGELILATHSVAVKSPIPGILFKSSAFSLFSVIAFSFLS